MNTTCGAVYYKGDTISTLGINGVYDNKGCMLEMHKKVYGNIPIKHIWIPKEYDANDEKYAYVVYEHKNKTFTQKITVNPDGRSGWYTSSLDHLHPSFYLLLPIAYD